LTAAPTSSDSRRRLSVAVLGAFAGAKLALHLVVLVVSPFGIHRDALLYFAMGNHLRFWRMDFPPFIAVMANLQTWLFGHSMAAARVLPALEGTAVLVMTVVIAAELGGGTFAQGLAALGVLCAGIFLRPSNLFQPVVLDQLWWTLSLYALLRVGRAAAAGASRGEHRWWIAFGVAAGLGLLTKFSILFLGLAVLGALVITPLRRTLRTPWPWAAAVIAVGIGSPSIVGQIALGYPVVGQMHDLAASQLSHVSWLSFVVAQPFMLGFTAFALAIAGAVALVASPRLLPYRAAGWACVLAFALLLVLHGKAYYIGPVFPTLLAGGATWLEGVSAGTSAHVRPAFRWIVVVLVAAEGLRFLPIALPILSPTGTARYIVAAGGEWALGTNRGTTDLLPQDFADQTEWLQQAAALSRVYHALPPDEQAQAVIGADNYGEAGAAEFYAPRFGLPPVVCGCGSYWYFGPGPRPGRVLIAIGDDSSDVAQLYGSVRRVARVLSPWGVAEERSVPIYLARQPHATLQQVWPTLGHGN
jgi:4-amino-4-deoxy-L-arabinose transferase-like glycosyltransferase